MQNAGHAGQRFAPRLRVHAGAGGRASLESAGYDCRFCIPGVLGSTSIFSGAFQAFPMSGGGSAWRSLDFPGLPSAVRVTGVHRVRVRCYFLRSHDLSSKGLTTCIPWFRWNALAFIGADSYFLIFPLREGGM